MSFNTISYLTKELELRREGMLNTLEWDSRDKILLKPSGCRLRRWGSYTLTYWKIGSIFWGPKASSGEEWLGAQYLAKKSKFSESFETWMTALVSEKLVSLKTKFVWGRYNVLSALPNSGIFEKNVQSLHSQQSVLLTWQVTGQGQRLSMPNQSLTSGILWLVIRCGDMAWLDRFIMDQWREDKWQARSLPRVPPQGIGYGV